MVERNDRIRPGKITASVEALELLQDRDRYARIQQHAVATVGQMFKARTVSDLALKIAVAKAFLDIPTSIWSAKLIGQVIYGGAPATTGGPKMTRMQQGEPVSEMAGAMLAQFFNYFLDDPIAADELPTEDVAADVAGWIETNSGFQWGLTPDDLAGDMLSFCRKLHQAVEMSERRPPSSVTEEAVHRRLMETLYAPLDHASWDTRLVVQDGRPRTAERERFRFGREQKVGTDPRGWTPIEIGSPDFVIEYGLPRRTDQPLKAWLVTVRDPSWKDISGNLTTGRWVWNQGWDKIIRWLPGFAIPAAAQIAAPTTTANTPDGMLPGLYRVFLFTETDDGVEAVANALRGDGLRPHHGIPDEAAYARLCDELGQAELRKRVSIYAGAYVIPG